MATAVRIPKLFKARNLVSQIRRWNTHQTASIEDGPYTMPIVKEKIRTGGELTYYDTINPEKCKGNFVALENGNVYLDLYQHGGIFALGYNNDFLDAECNSERFQRAMLNSNLGEDFQNIFQSHQYFELLEKTLLALAPNGMSCIHTLQSDKSPLIEAVRIAVSRYKENRRFKWDTSYKGFHEDERVSGKCFSVISLQNSEFNLINYHYPVEVIPLPKKYKDVSTSQEESQCLEVCYQTIKNAILSMKHPAAMVIDPIRLSRGTLSNEFFQTLQIICKEFDVAFIINELNTSLGVTEEIWAHDQWDLIQPPDMVVFGKKMLNSGFYTQTGFLSPEVLKCIKGSCEIARLMLLDITLKYISEQNLLASVARTSDVLDRNMTQIQQTFPDLVENISCNGLMCSIDFFDKTTKNKADIMLLNKGLHFGRVMDKSLTMMPALILNEQHVAYIHESLHSILQELMNNKRTSLGKTDFTLGKQ